MGLQLLKTLKDEKRNIPSLMISGYGDEELVGFGDRVRRRRLRFETVFYGKRDECRKKEISMIKFGTSGWRSIMAEDFTFANSRRVVQAIATYLKEHRKDEKTPVIVGYDPRFLGPEFARDAAAVLASNGFHVLFSDDFIPNTGGVFPDPASEGPGRCEFHGQS